MRAGRPTKRGCALAVSHLIDCYGTRWVLEAVADYLRVHLNLNIWSARYEVAKDELFPGGAEK